MKFLKMDGCGNDFILVVPSDKDRKYFTKTRIRKLCDRHSGIGADGLILVLPPTSRIADFRMRMFNPDGSEAEICGNGIRCLGKLVYEQGLTRKKELVIETAKSNVPIKLFLTNGKVSKVRVNLPEPELVAPLSSSQFSGILDFKHYEIVKVSLGNPHCVIFMSGDVSKLPIERYGPEMEKHKLFANRTNVEFVNIMNKSAIKMRVWERGAGETMACGSGACAAVVAGISAGRLGSNSIKVQFPGGQLDILWRKGTGIYLTGPAEFVFSGNLLLH